MPELPTSVSKLFIWSHFFFAYCFSTFTLQAFFIVADVYGALLSAFRPLALSLGLTQASVLLTAATADCKCSDQDANMHI